jgi:hypothetical protein
LLVDGDEVVITGGTSTRPLGESSLTMTERKAVDGIQQRIAGYANALSYTELTAETIQAAKVRVIDTLGSLIGGFEGEPCRIARRLAARLADPEGATIVGTASKTTPEMAAFANATAARYVEMNDVYHWPGSAGGHPSDVVMPILAAGEHTHASGPDFIAAIVLGYEIYLRLSDAIGGSAFDCANFACIGAAAASGRLMGLSTSQLAHAVSMAAVPNNILKRVRTGHLSMWKAVAAGHAGKEAVFAALLAREGMDAPSLPFEGKQGWTDHVAGKTVFPGRDGRARRRVQDTGHPHQAAFLLCDDDLIDTRSGESRAFRHAAAGRGGARHGRDLRAREDRHGHRRASLEPGLARDRRPQHSRTWWRRRCGRTRTPRSSTRALRRSAQLRGCCENRSGIERRVHPPTKGCGEHHRVRRRCAAASAYRQAGATRAISERKSDRADLGEILGDRGDSWARSAREACSSAVA